MCVFVCKIYKCQASIAHLILSHNDLISSHFVSAFPIIPYTIVMANCPLCHIKPDTSASVYVSRAYATQTFTNHRAATKLGTLLLDCPTHHLANSWQAHQSITHCTCHVTHTFCSYPNHLIHTLAPNISTRFIYFKFALHPAASYQHIHTHSCICVI